MMTDSSNTPSTPMTPDSNTSSQPTMHLEATESATDRKIAALILQMAKQSQSILALTSTIAHIKATEDERIVKYK
eukprot:scaffold84271_cov61-Attheya_sp.AAC.1